MDRPATACAQIQLGSPKSRQSIWDSVQLQSRSKDRGDCRLELFREVFWNLRQTSAYVTVRANQDSSGWGNTVKFFEAVGYKISSISKDRDRISFQLCWLIVCSGQQSKFPTEKIKCGKLRPSPLDP
jgi:hypothetical protein